MTPKPGKYALDTNVVIALLNGDAAVSERWADAEVLLLPVPVLGELLYGALRSSRRSDNEQRVRIVVRHMELIECDGPVCENYAQIKAALATAGRPIPENDLWISACEAAAGAALVTRDDHFKHIPELVIEEW